MKRAFQTLFPTGSLRAFFLLTFVLFFISSPAFSAPRLSADGETLIVEDTQDTEVIAFGKTVVVKERAKGVFTFGGDIIVEGRVEGDVGAIGGSVIQKKDAFIGGDVIIIGGSYRPEIDKPLRNEGKETVMVGVFEDEIRNFARNPAELFSPDLSIAFFAQRVLSILFWFILSLSLATIAPGAVSRSAARLQLSTLKIAAFGFFAFIAVTIAVVASISLLPNYISGVFGLMAFVLVMLAYAFGRVTLHVSTGKYLQKILLPEQYRSETLSILIGVVAWTVLLSLPYIWPFALLALFGSGIGLVLTAPHINRERRPENGHI